MNEFYRSKIILNNKSITEQVSNFNYLGCNVTYKYDEDLNDTLSKFQNICGEIVRTQKEENQERNKNLIFFKTMAVPVLLYGSETWTLRKSDEQNSSGRDEIFKNSKKDALDKIR
jgi:hypothetical protein